MQEAGNQSNLSNLFGVASIPKDTQMREVLDTVPTNAFADVFPAILNRLQRGRQLEQYQFIDQKYLMPIDGSEYFTSEKLHCPHCLKNQTP